VDDGFVEVGCGRADITPPVGCLLAGSYCARRAEQVARPLEAIAVLLQSRGKRLAFVVLDLILLESADVARIKAEAARSLGLAPEEIFVSCTHTHSGPCTAYLHLVPKETEYVDSLPAKVASALEAAAADMKRVRFAGAWGAVYGVSFNRRYLRTDGRVEMNAAPSRGIRPIRHAGPVDPELSVLYFEGAEGEPAALFAAMALHYVGGQGPNSIDPDYFRDFRDAVAERMGASCCAVLANGASGDVNNVDIFHLADYKADMRAVADKVADEAVRAVREWGFRPGPPDIRCATRSFTVVKRMPTREMIRAAEKILAETTPDADPVGYGNAKAHLEMAAGGERERTLELIAARIGDVAVLGLPGEVFAEIGMTIKTRSPFPMLHLLGNTNGWHGYIPARHCFAEGSYETDLTAASFCGEETGERMVEESLALLESLR